MAGEVHIHVPEAEAAVAQMRAHAQRFQELVSGLGNEIRASGATAMTPNGTSGTPSKDVQPAYRDAERGVLDALPKLAQSGQQSADSFAEYMTKQAEADAQSAANFRGIAPAG